MAEIFQKGDDFAVQLNIYVDNYQRSDYRRYATRFKCHVSKFLEIGPEGMPMFEVVGSYDNVAAVIQDYDAFRDWDQAGWSRDGSAFLIDNGVTLAEAENAWGRRIRSNQAIVDYVMKLRDKES